MNAMQMMKALGDIPEALVSCYLNEAPMQTMLTRPIIPYLSIPKSR